MKFARLASRVAVGGVSAALATTGLVAATGTSASAAPVSTTYTCVTPIGPITAAVSVDIALLPATAPAGFPVPAGLLSFKSNLTIDNATATTLAGVGVTGAKSDDFGTAFGATVAKAPVVWTGPPTSDATNTTFAGKGANGAFLLPKAGTYTVAMPSTFTLIATNSSGATVASAPCTSTATPATIGTIALSKQVAKVKAKAPKSAKAGSTVKVKVKVSNDYSKTGGAAVTGKVTVKDGSKKYTGTVKNGKVSIKIKGIKAGTHNLAVSYGGDDFTAKSKKVKLKITVKK